MARPIKYTPLIASQIVTLAFEGYPDWKIAKLMELGKNTIVRWRKKYPQLLELMDEARAEGAKETIEIGLKRLAKGAVISTQVEKFKTTRLIKRVDSEGNETESIIPVERTITKKEKAPDTKAIEVLNRKYYKEFDHNNEEREVMTKILEGFTMRELQEARKDNPIDLAQEFFKSKFSIRE